MERQHGVDTAEMRTREDTLAHIGEIQRVATVTKKKELRKKYGVKEGRNHFLDLRLDLHLLFKWLAH